jgi:hypothetical protein
MRHRVKIDTPFPSLAETARILGVSSAEAVRVQRMLYEYKPRKHIPATEHRPTSRYVQKGESKRR